MKDQQWASPCAKLNPIESEHGELKRGQQRESGNVKDLCMKQSSHLLFSSLIRHFEEDSELLSKQMDGAEANVNWKTNIFLRKLFLLIYQG